MSLRPRLSPARPPVPGTCQTASSANISASTPTSPTLKASYARRTILALASASIGHDERTVLEAVAAAAERRFEAGGDRLEACDCLLDLAQLRLHELVPHPGAVGAAAKECPNLLETEPGLLEDGDDPQPYDGVFALRRTVESHGVDFPVHGEPEEGAARRLFRRDLAHGGFGRRLEPQPDTRISRQCSPEPAPK